MECFAQLLMRQLFFYKHHLFYSLKRKIAVATLGCQPKLTDILQSHWPRAVLNCGERILVAIHTTNISRSNPRYFIDFNRNKFSYDIPG